MSSSFQEGAIPKKFTCDGADDSPELAWAVAPVADAEFCVVDKDTLFVSFTHRLFTH